MTDPAAAPLRPLVPLAPVSGPGAFGAARAPSVLDAGPARLVTSGRIAIANALREMGVGAGDEVLVPAYHSLSMLPPVLASGARAVFYKVGPDAAADLADIAAKLSPASKVLMVTHYFGFPQPLAQLRALCDARGLLLLEDCAHCFFGSYQGRPVGSWGDYAIASSMKFFPIYEGGCLVSARHALAAPAPRSAGVLFELKSALNALEHDFAFGRRAPLKALLWLPLRLKAALWRARAGAPLAPSSSDSSVDFDPAWLDKRSSWFSRMVLRRSSHGRIVERRRSHYRQLEQAVAGLAGCRPLFARLPDGVCPWMFPLWVERPQEAFERLLAARVPVTRFAQSLWPGVDASVCADSAALSRHVLAIPCHQGLRADEMAWLAGALRAAVRA
jgi:perosamine synthetase